MSNSADRKDLLLVGRVTGAHGIHGGLKIHSYADGDDLYHTGEAILLVRPDGVEEVLTVQWVKPLGRGLILGATSIVDRNQAESLSGSSLFIAKSRLPALEEDTYYWSDLIGLQVVDPSGTLLGRLEAVIPTAGNDVYVVKGTLDGHPREILVPAVGAVVQRIDLAGKTMVVDLPEGL